MNQITVLVIDDSATIRRLVDTHLSQAGYHVVLAPTAEEGVEKAHEVRPNLILLDHQLPGTTGFQVCQQLLGSPEICNIPVVISSTLRKKAYVEYADAANVVDMLPKPYAPELLLTTVENVLETGQLIVESQSEGTAVPEVMQQEQDVTLSGSFDSFDLREVLDFLNNGNKSGLVEVDAERNRVSFYIAEGRLQGVTATGFDPQEIADELPEALRDLAPVASFTIGGRFSAEVDGLVQLLDKKVIDQRLLRQLLRHQAALLTRRCVNLQLKTFRFQANAAMPPLFQKLRLDISLAALLVDGALGCAESELPAETEQTVYQRSAVRGQNLDRAGLSAQHMKILSQLSDPMSSYELAQRLNCDHDEVRRVLYGLTLAKLVESQEQQNSQTVFALEHDPVGVKVLRSLLTTADTGYSGRVVRDQLGLQLLMKRKTPDAVLMAVDTEEFQRISEKFSHAQRDSGGPRLIAILPKAEGEQSNGQTPPNFDAAIHRPYTEESIIEAIQATPLEEPQDASCELAVTE